MSEMTSGRSVCSRKWLFVCRPPLGVSPVIPPGRGRGHAVAARDGAGRRALHDDVADVADTPMYMTARSSSVIDGSSAGTGMLRIMPRPLPNSISSATPWSFFALASPSGNRSLESGSGRGARHSGAHRVLRRRLEVRDVRLRELQTHHGTRGGGGRSYGGPLNGFTTRTGWGSTPSVRRRPYQRGSAAYSRRRRAQPPRRRPADGDSGDPPRRRRETLLGTSSTSGPAMTGGAGRKGSGTAAVRKADVDRRALDLHKRARTDARLAHSTCHQLTWAAAVEKMGRGGGAEKRRAMGARAVCVLSVYLA